MDFFNSLKNRKGASGAAIGAVVILALAFIVASVSYMLPAFAEHTATVIITPDNANCNQLGKTFTVNVANNAGDTEDIIQVEIYKALAGISQFSCGAAPTGWDVFSYTDRCIYVTELAGAYKIKNGEDLDFTFDATMSSDTCQSLFIAVTVDDAYPTGDRDTHNLYVDIDCTDPVIEKEITSGTYMGVCPPSTQSPGDICWMTQGTIHVTAYDNADVCDLGIAYCEWDFTVDGVPSDNGNETNGDTLGWDIIFDEDSEHILTITCYDKAGNSVTDVETFKVDDTPPETTKTVSEPKKIVPTSNPEIDVEYVDTYTEITFDVVDGGDICAIGVDKTWYKNVVYTENTENCVASGYDYCYQPDVYCNENFLGIVNPYDNTETVGCINYWQEECASDECPGEPGELCWQYLSYDSWGSCVEDKVHEQCGLDTEWKIYDGAPITKDQESCHVLYYFSVDNLGNVENMQYNCFFVDKTPPELTKDIGSPVVGGGLELTTSGDGVSEWSTVQSHTAPYSVHMETPGTNDQGRAILPYSGLLSGITSFSYWSYSHDAGTADQLSIWASFYLDEDDDGNWDYYLQCEPYYTYGYPTLDTWAQFDVMNMMCQNYELSSGLSIDCPHDSPTLAQYINGDATTMECPGHPEYGNFASREYGSLKVLHIDMRAGYGGPWAGFDGYIDDIELNGDVYGNPGSQEDPWWVTSDTEIAFTCIDQMPHPSGDEEICFKVSYDVPEYPTYITDQYCDPEDMEDGWCCVDVDGNNQFIFNFNEDEDSFHDLEYYCRDAVEKHTDTQIQYYKVDNTPPSLVDKWINGPYYAKVGDCPPDDPSDVCHINGVSTIDIDVVDGGDVCAVDQVWCRWGYTLDDGDFFGWYETFPIDFPEESKHDLVIECFDALGNEMQVDEETFYVDETPPETTKTYDGPQYPVAVAHPMYITSSTLVSLSATDDTGPHDSGVVATYYRDVYLPEEEDWHYCAVDCEEWNPSEPCDPLDPVSEGWTEWTGTPFTKSPESCHIIEYYSVDNVDKVEDIKWQCVFVDNTPPTLLDKVVGTPKVEKDEKTYITGETDITISCQDQGDHPVNNVMLWYRYRISDDCETWGEWLTDGCEGEVVNGWCDSVVDSIVEKTIYFPQDSCHELEYYCVDALGNEAQHETEIDVVDNQAPEITKTIIGPSMDCSGAIGEPAELCDGWEGCEIIDEKKDFFVTGRYGSGGWKNAIWDWTESTSAPQVTNGVAWPNGVEKDFSVTYDASTGDVTYTQDGETLVYTYETDKAFSYIVAFAKGNANGNSVELSDLVLNGKPLPFVSSGDSYRGVMVPLSDTQQYNGFVLTGKAKLIWDGNPKDEIPAFHVYAMDTHDRVDCFIDGVTVIEVDVVDPDPHPVGEVVCKWDYEVLDGNKEGSGQIEVTPPFNVSFPEESTHLLMIKCEDELHNSVEDEEVFIVDKTPPYIWKEYGWPYYEECVEWGYIRGGCGGCKQCIEWAEWISNTTNIHISVDDEQGEHVSGVKNVSYRVSLVPDENCWDSSVCDETTGSGDWLPASESFDFNINEDSCHLIEIKAYDNVDKENYHRQCVFVDTRGPMPVKTVGEPKDQWFPGEPGEPESYFYPEETAHCWDTTENEIECWEATTLTPIVMDCDDSWGGDDTHPVGDMKVCFKVDVDAEDQTLDYCMEYGGWYNWMTGYCCRWLGPDDDSYDHSGCDFYPYKDQCDEVQDIECYSNRKLFYFLEETEHNLEYYCVDKLWNEGPVDDEKFKIEGEKFEIPLFKKWNLVSVPFTLLDDKPETVFSKIFFDGKQIPYDDPENNISMYIDSVTTYDPDHVICGQDWCIWTPGEAPDNLRILPGWGYWVMVTDKPEEECKWGPWCFWWEDNEEPLWMVIGGSLFSPAQTPPSRNLTKGWNLIGYYGTNWEEYDWSDFDFMCGEEYTWDKYLYGEEVYCALNSLVDTQEGYPRWSSLWSYVNCGDHNTDWLGLNACYSPSPFVAQDRMYAGRGYWIEIDVSDLYAPATNCIWNSDFVCALSGGGFPK